jgi:hypothetical protein
MNFQAALSASVLFTLALAQQKGIGFPQEQEAAFQQQEQALTTEMLPDAQPLFENLFQGICMLVLLFLPINTQ